MSRSLKLTRPELEAADLGFGRADREPGRLPADPAGLAEAAQLRADHDASDGWTARRQGGHECLPTRTGGQGAHRTFGAAWCPIYS